MHRSFSRTNILTFLLYAFCGAWALWGIALLACKSGRYASDSSFVMTLLMLGALAPFFASYRVFTLNKEIDGKKSFRRFMLGTPPVFLGYAIFVILVVWRPLMFALSSEWTFPLSFLSAGLLPLIPSLFLGGGFEEFGWRGYLHPALQRYLPSMSVPAVVGVIWAVWHAPLFFIPGTLQSNLSFVHFLLLAVTLSYSFGLLKDTWDSPLACVFQHAWFNACFYLQIAGIGVTALLLCALETLIVIFLMQMTVRRGRMEKVEESDEGVA